MLTAVLAATLDVAEKINQFGAYAGLAAIVGLAVLSLLYFSQAREIKRLREWAGRSPERAAELEAAATQAAQQRLAPHPQARGAAAPVAGAVASQSTTVSPARPVPGAPLTPAAGQPARQQVPPGQAVTAAGTPSPGTPVKPAPSPAAAAASSAAAAAAAAGATGTTGPTGPTPAAQQPTTASPATPKPPAASTPVGPPPVAQRPVTPTPAVPAPQSARAQSAAPLRAPSAAAYGATAGRGRNDSAQRELGVEGRSPLRSTLMIVGGVIAVAVVVFVLVTQLFGSDDPSSTPANTIATTASTTPKTETTAKKKKKSTSPAAVVRGDTTVAVLNGTTTPGLAASQSTTLVDKGFKAGGTGDAPVKPVEATTIYYAPDQRAAADEVAGVLGLPATSIKAIDSTISGVSAVGTAQVVVVVGADQATPTG